MQGGNGLQVGQQVVGKHVQRLIFAGEDDVVVVSTGGDHLLDLFHDVTGGHTVAFPDGAVIGSLDVVHYFLLGNVYTGVVSLGFVAVNDLAGEAVDGGGAYAPAPLQNVDLSAVEVNDIGINVRILGNVLGGGAAFRGCLRSNGLGACGIVARYQQGQCHQADQQKQ